MKFRKLVLYFERLEATTKRLEMIDILAELFKSIDNQDEIDKVIYLCQGQLLPSFKNIEFGMSDKLIHKVIVEATGDTSEKILDMFQKMGDYGEVAQQLCEGKKEVPTLTQVYKLLAEVATVSGSGAVAKKVGILAKLLNDVSALEAKYVVRIILGRLRLGVGDPTVLDSLSLAYTGDKSLRKKLERAYNLCSDLGLVAKILFQEGIKEIENFKIIVGCPIRVALAARLKNPKEIIEKIGKCAVESKYDGFRAQVHKDGNKINIYSRNLEDTTLMFPEIEKAVRENIKTKKVIFEGEAISYDPDTGECLPFQVTVQRKRKYNINEMQELYPLRIYIFDILYADGDLTREPYQTRRKIMSEVIKDGKVLKKAPFEVVDDAKRLSDIFEKAANAGLEGIVAKRLDGPYRAGGRDFNWIKLKRSYENNLTDTIDCVLVGYFVGKGARAALGIGSLLGCVYDKKNDSFKTIAKIGSGVTEAEWIRIKAMMDKLKTKTSPVRLESQIVPDVWVNPKLVVEVQADEITKSPVHTCGKTENESAGFALRFPRMVRFVRDDKNPEDATSVDEILKMFKMQGRKSNDA
ncbi:MAG: ATP-dependent DNA ligase [PVC group bacterium]|nr:ATP-dependent DNA ligase [PVC group bacterium]